MIAEMNNSDSEDSYCTTDDSTTGTPEVAGPDRPAAQETFPPPKMAIISTDGFKIPEARKPNAFLRVGEKRGPETNTSAALPCKRQCTADEDGKAITDGNPYSQKY